MTNTQHVNLLYTKEITQKRKKVTKLIHNIIFGLGGVTILLVLITSVVSYVQKSTHSKLVEAKNTLSSQLANHNKDAIDISIINAKAEIIKSAVSKERTLGDYYNNGINFLPPYILKDNHLKSVTLDSSGEGIFELEFVKFDDLNTFLTDIERAKRGNTFKAYRIEKINVQEGSPSASIVQMNVQFK